MKVTKRQVIKLLKALVDNPNNALQEHNKELPDLLHLDLEEYVREAAFDILLYVKRVKTKMQPLTSKDIDTLLSGLLSVLDVTK